MNVWATVATGTALVAAAIGVYVWWANGQFNDKVAGLVAMVLADQAQSGPPPVLPKLVRDYAVRAGGREGYPQLFHATHVAELTTRKGASPLAITAEQWTGTGRPGIVWRASGTMLALPVNILDVFANGRGELSARIAGVVPVAGGEGPAYDKGELMRYLSELPVYPDAILNNGAITWRQIDDHTAEAKAQSAGGPAILRFYFDPAGDIVRMEADDRPMAGDNGETRPTPWHGLYGRYQRFGRYRIPAYGEVGWVLDDGLFTYWRGTVSSYEPLQ